MGATARLTDPAVRVECGSEGVCQLTVRNTGTVVDEFGFTVLGDAAAWTSVAPPSLSLFPDAEGSVTVTFAPPREPGTPLGEVAFAVRVSSREDPSGSVVEEGRLDVVGFVDCSAEIVPRTSRGRQAGRHEVAIDNRGNTAVEVALSGTDPDEALAFHFSDPTLTAAPGTASFRQVRVSTRGLLWRGTPQTIAFSVTVAPQGQPPIRLDASFQQQPMIPAWLPRTIAVVFGLILASLVVWKVVLQPQVRKTVAQSPAVQKNAQDIESVAKQTGAVLPSSGPSATASPPATGGNPVTVPVRITALPGPNNIRTVAVNFPEGSKALLSVNQVIGQNPFNDAGLVTVRRVPVAAAADEADVIFQQSLFGQPNPTLVLTPPLALAREDALQVTLQCVKPGTIATGDPNDPGQPRDQCSIVVLITGFVRNANAAPSPSPVP